jgi:hypothetical protein
MNEAIVVQAMLFGSIVLIVFIVGMFLFLRARMRHREIMAAIEKGVSLSELRASEFSKPHMPRWIGNMSLGIAFLIVSPVFIVHGLLSVGRSGMGNIIPTFICFGIGVCFLIRGLLFRKYEHQAAVSTQPNMQ